MFGLGRPDGVQRRGRVGPRVSPALQNRGAVEVTGDPSGQGFSLLFLTRRKQSTKMSEFSAVARG
jgi:hypothetical protein